MMNPTTTTQARSTTQNTAVRTAEALEAEGAETTDEVTELDAADVIPYVNSVDATIGQPIVARVMTRKHELEAALEALPTEDLRGRGDLELALSTIGELLTGDLTNVPAVVAADMNQWLERNKHLAERAAAVPPATPAPVVETAPAEPTIVSDDVVAPVVEPGTAQTPAAATDTAVVPE